MTDAHPVDGEGSYYFPRQPVIQPLRDDRSSSSSPFSSLGSLPQKTFHRPPTPVFPRVATPPTRPSTANGKKTAKNYQPKMNKQAYARLLSRLGGEMDHEENLPRSRSRSNSTSDTALSAALRLLAQETARADAAERQQNRDAEALLSLVRQAKEARERTELDLARVREELNLHKLQLVVAQSEIDRAQRIVAEVERARVVAEERSNRDRDRVRRFAAERAVEIARQEGRNEGWRQGLERGKWVAWAEVQRREMAEYEDDEEERSLSPPPRRNRTSNHTPRPSGQIRTGTGERAMGATSNVAPRAEVPPFRPPSTSQPADQYPVPIPVRPRSPENVSVRETQSRAQTPQSPLHSLPRTPPPRSPSVATSLRSRRSVTHPLDVFIPTVGPDEVISVPAPFELSRPVALAAATAEAPNATTSAGVSRGETETRDSDRQSERESQQTPRTRSSLYGSAPAQQRTYDDVFRERAKGKGTPAMSTASTHISQYDLISPPRNFNSDRVRRTYGANDPEQRGRVPRTDGDSQTGAMSSRGGERVEEWQAASPSVTSPTPTTHMRASGRRPMSSIYSMSTGSQRPIEDPISRPQTSNSTRIYSPRTSGNPGLPGEHNVTTPAPQSGGHGGGTASHIYRASSTTESHPLQQSYIPPQHHSPTISSADYAHQHQQSTPIRPQQNLDRSYSSTTVPDISIEPPSHSPTNSSGKTALDQLLLTPDHTPVPLEPASGSEGPQSTDQDHSGHDGGDTATIVVPENDLPPGFMLLSPIPSITNFKMEDHDPHRMHEQYQGGGYQIYAAPAVFPDTPIGIGMSSGVPFSSLLFTEAARPSTSGTSATTAIGDNPGRKEMSFGTPLDHPVSLYSDT